MPSFQSPFFISICRKFKIFELQFRYTSSVIRLGEKSLWFKAKYFEPFNSTSFKSSYVGSSRTIKFTLPCNQSYNYLRSDPLNSLTQVLFVFFSARSIISYFYTAFLIHLSDWIFRVSHCWRISKFFTIVTKNRISLDSLISDHFYHDAYAKIAMFAIPCNLKNAFKIFIFVFWSCSKRFAFTFFDENFCKVIQRFRIIIKTFSWNQSSNSSVAFTIGKHIFHFDVRLSKPVTLHSKVTF